MPYSMIRTEDGFPLVIDQDGRLHEHISRYLMYLYDVRVLELSTVYFQASRLVHWLNFLDDNGIELYSVTRRTILEYRKKNQEDDMSESSNNLRMSDACHFYWFAQNDKGWCSGVIGINNMIKGRSYRIVVRKPTSHLTEFHMPFLLKVPRREKQHVPTSDDIAKLKEALYESTSSSAILHKEELNARNQLMVRWMCEGALRREEVVELRKDDIPKFIRDGNEDRLYKVTLKHGTKYGKTRTIEVEASLIKETHNFIDFDREEITKLDPPTVFVSSNTNGNGSLKPSTLTDLLTDVCEDVPPHGCRRYSLTRKACILYRIERAKAKSNERYQIDEKAVLDKVAQFAGHADASTTTQFYIDLARVLTLDDNALECLEDRERALRSELAEIKAQKEAHKGMLIAV
ncbi:site-specific integrase [Thalassotalea sp. PS06]|uniref:site-specific integrase n=1 Tax=Thalassotalea sp. PS06 TaxID=2594005 RepID=UPI001163A7F5|nr:site-specific integrase [Thalassotalea sp. PS06]QDP00663.1 site-specific integrase [Thalassotalea sp. PS06]